MCCNESATIIAHVSRQYMTKHKIVEQQQQQ